LPDFLFPLLGRELTILLVPGNGPMNSRE